MTAAVGGRRSTEEIKELHEGFRTVLVLSEQIKNLNKTVERIALVRNGSITHAQDMSQRYVELAHALPTGNSPFLSIQVQAPLDGFIAPPGYYLLYVVERKSGPGLPKLAPSEGKWVRLE